jgi:osmoprotectant transport system substrate-binding protein
MTQKFVRICLAAIVLLVASTAISQACVGRILYVGAIETVEGQTMAELLVLLINERTGTNVKIRYFDDNIKLYQAFKSHEEEIRVDIIIENTADAMALMQKDRIKDLDQEYLTVKKFYEKELDATWLKAFGFKNIKGSNNPSVSASLIRNDVLTNYPLLPRILNKLSGAIDEKTFSEMIGKVRSGSKAKNVVKDFLRAKKFI